MRLSKIFILACSALNVVDEVGAACTEKEFHDYLRNVENAGKTGFRDGKWHPHDSPEGGPQTIAYGHKLTAADGDKFDDGITEQEAEDLMKGDLDKAKGSAKDYITENHGADAWDGMTDTNKRAATEFAFNLGSLNGFPKFTKALVENDRANMEKEYKRHYTTPEGETKELTRRNELFRKTFLDEEGQGTGCPDPHFKTWGGKKFDYHGACDLIYLQSSVFGAGQGLDIHLRTKHRSGTKHRGGRVWSAISNILIRIGTDVFEVLENGTYYFNYKINATLPLLLAGKYSVDYLEKETENGPRAYWVVDLQDEQLFKVTHWKSNLAFSIKGSKHEDFHNMSGLSSTWDQRRKMIGRDGKTDFSSNHTAFGEEWQVQEPSLFHAVDNATPQHPESCIPEPSVNRRLLSHASAHHRRAQEACGHVEGPDNSDCMFDVVLTGDVSWAQAPWFLKE